MKNIPDLVIQNPKNIYHEVAVALAPYRGYPPLSVQFIVERIKNKPLVSIKYPGRKVVKRDLKCVRANSIKWGNLYDFQVVPLDGNVEAQDLTFERILRDFEENKRNSEELWKAIEEVYYHNVVRIDPPVMKGINSSLFLSVLKWIWIEEDFNYRLGWKDVNSPEKYVLLTRKGNPTAKGAGRAKFFAAMILLKHNFSFEEVKKIITMYA